MSKLPYLPLFTNDWLASAKITMMTPAEEGAYVRLLCLAWNDDACSLPTDDASLATMSRLNSHWPESSAKLRACFEEHDGRLYNEKLLQLWQKSHIQREKKREGGVKGMLKRWGNRDNKRVITNLKDSYPEVNNMPITSIPIPIPIPISTPSQDYPPPPPKGGADGVPAKQKRLSQTERRRMRVAENSPLIARIGAWFRRKPETPWTVVEARSLEDLNPPEDEVATMERYYTAEMFGEDYRRRAVEQLLNNWQTELDRARKYLEQKGELPPCK